MKSFNLLNWALATFHTTFFFVIIIFITYTSGILANLLASLNTLIGLALFAVLWATTWITTRRAIRSMDWHSLDEALDNLKLIAVSFIAGGANGTAFFLVITSSWGIIALLITLFSIGQSSAANMASAVFGFVIGASLVLTFGSVFAFLIGGFIGLFFALIDGLLIALTSDLWDKINPFEITTHTETQSNELD